MKTSLVDDIVSTAGDKAVVPVEETANRRLPVGNIFRTYDLMMSQITSSLELGQKLPTAVDSRSAADYLMRLTQSLGAATKNAARLMEANK